MSKRVATIGVRSSCLASIFVVFAWLIGMRLDRVKIVNGIVLEAYDGSVNIFTPNGMDMMRNYAMSGHPPPFPPAHSLCKFPGFTFWKWNASLRYLIAPGWSVRASLLYLVVPPVVLMIAFVRKGTQTPTQSQKCDVCEYDLTGNVSGVCPECGTRIKPARTLTH
jgi:hypothetical protein